MRYYQQLLKVMNTETYRGYPLRQISKDKYQFGIKTGTKEEIKRFIDEIKHNERTSKNIAIVLWNAGLKKFKRKGNQKE